MISLSLSRLPVEALMHIAPDDHYQVATLTKPCSLLSGRSGQMQEAPPANHAKPTS